MRVILAAAATAALLTGCADPGPAPGTAGSPIPALYCYRTLVAVDCHSKPLEDETYRLIGYEGPAPKNPGFAVHGRPGS